MSKEQSEGHGPGAKGQGFRELLAWQKAHALALAVFQATQQVARSHEWVVRQCTRSAVSVPANVAEGYSRTSRRDYLRYLNIARGSLAETEYYLLFMRDSALLPAGTVHQLESLRIEAGNFLVGLIRSLEAKERAEPRQLNRIREEQAEYFGAPLSDDNGLGPWPLAHDPPEPGP